MNIKLCDRNYFEQVCDSNHVHKICYIITIKNIKIDINENVNDGVKRIYMF